MENLVSNLYEQINPFKSIQTDKTPSATECKNCISMVLASLFLSGYNINLTLQNIAKDYQSHDLKDFFYIVRSFHERPNKMLQHIYYIKPKDQEPKYHQM